ncbi:MAG: M15 family metallopeptidase [Bacteroides sp.]|nr:M15 family metallopeptidase [Bacteroides sp.]
MLKSLNLMNRDLFAIASTFFIIGMAFSCQSNAEGHIKNRNVSSDKITDVDSMFESSNTDLEINPKFQALKNAYPDFIQDVKNNTVFFTDGTTMEFDDMREKDFVTRLDDCDIEDMFSMVYVVPDSMPEYLADAGRMRSDDLFKKMYGNSAKAVHSNLVSVDWFGQKVWFSKNNGAADSLSATAYEISQYPELKPFLKSSGTFYWRPVRGAKRMSAHSYGIAFDIAVDKSDYWLWKSKNNDELAKVKYSNRIPKKLVEIFQRHGFIWGGAWYHFDTMHFEFRPEILNYAEIVKP